MVEETSDYRDPLRVNRSERLPASTRRYSDGDHYDQVERPPMTVKTSKTAEIIRCYFLR